MKKIKNKSIAVVLTVMLTVLLIPAVSYASSEADTIYYSADAGDEIEFDEDDFNDFCQDENDADLDYVYFELPDSDEGTLYYDYDGDDEEELDEDDAYYYDDDPSISDITFVPDDDFSGECVIDFEGYDEYGDSIEGSVAISIEKEDLGFADTIYFSGTAGSEVTFVASYFNTKCEDLTDNTLDYVEFTLPSASKGTLYYYYTSPTDYSSLVYSSSQYYYEDESPYIKYVSFVPYGTADGTATIEYTGYATDGSSYTGEIQITYTAASTAESATAGNAAGSGSLYFGDVDDNYSWAASYIDSLYTAGIVTGEVASDNSKKFNPADNITRGDFLLLLSRALNLQPAADSDNFADVPDGSYYYDAIAAAKALSIAQGTGNTFNPDAVITREDAMVLALRAVNAAGAGVASSSVDDLSSYSDHGSVSDYAQEAIAALIKAGIINGSDGQIHPKDNITRAEAAAVIYRIKY